MEHQAWDEADPLVGPGDRQSRSGLAAVPGLRYLCSDQDRYRELERGLWLSGFHRGASGTGRPNRRRRQEPVHLRQDAHLWRLREHPGQSQHRGDRGASVYMGSEWFELARTLFTPRPAAPPAPAAAAEPGLADEPESRSSRIWFSWAGTTSEPLCQDDVSPHAAAADSPAERLAIAMVSDRERIDRAIIQTAAHEVGHTLGLRHNFKGSLMPPSSTVMDYMSLEGKAASPKPGPYDVAAIRYLYNLTETLPSEPFCTPRRPRGDQSTLHPARLRGRFRSTIFTHPPTWLRWTPIWLRVWPRPAPGWKPPRPP